MAGALLLSALVLELFVLAYGCPTNCTCASLNGKGTRVVCNTMTIEGQFPESTSEVHLTNRNLDEVPWDTFRTLKQLSYINVAAIRVNCNDCKYFKYWDDVIRHKKVNISGTCGGPVDRIGRPLATGGSGFSKCQTTTVPPIIGKPSTTARTTTEKQTTTPRPTTEGTTTSKPTTTFPPTTKKTTQATTKTTTQATTKKTTHATTKRVIVVTEGVVTEPSTTEQTTTVKPTARAPGAPEVKLSLLSPDVPIGSLAWVLCQVSGYPKPEVVMTLNGVPVSEIDGVTYNTQPNGADMRFVASYDSEVTCTAVNHLDKDRSVMRVPIDRKSIGYLLMKIKLINEVYSSKLTDKTSSQFIKLQEKISKAFAVVFRDFVGYYGSTLISVSPGSVIANVLVKTANTSEAAVKKVIEQEMVDAKLASISVDRYYYSFQTAMACHGEYLNTTWSDMIPGQIIIEKCPRGAKGYARRNCTPEGEWYYPDYTNCYSDEFTYLYDQMTDVTKLDSKIQNPEEKIHEYLNNLTSLTMPNEEDRAEMAGNIGLSVNILEKLVSYTRRKRDNVAKGRDETETVLHIASNLLNRNNEQEFIVAQKVVQTASALIRALEEYGLQSALALTIGNDDLTFIIQDNIVMGAGVVHSHNVTKDVTFPDYNIKEVDQVRMRWNASSFLIIDVDMVKEMEAGQLKLAGFMYKTLTRILSAESAYSEIGYGYEINSAVIAMGLDPKPKKKFSKPVYIASKNLQSVKLDGDQPICAFWDFELNAPNGGWSEEGCWYTHYNTENTTCLCDHMTNFAVLRDKPLVLTGALTAKPVEPPFLLCILIGCIIMVCFCGITLFLLLIAAWRMKPDRTWGMHMFICATLIVAFALIIVGLYSYNDVQFCHLLSLLVHYFYLCAFTWILAEAVYMHIWSTQNGPKRRHWIGYFFLGFIVPGIPMALAWYINGVQGFESPWSCWMVLFPGYLVWVFLGPAIFCAILAIMVFRAVWRIAMGPLRAPLKATYWRTRFRVHVRYSVAILIMLLITWLMGVLVVTFFQKVSWIVGLVMCILFILCCAVTGLLIVVFYCIMDRQFDDAIRECCCLCCRGRRGKYWVRGDEYWAEERPVQESPQEEAEELMPPDESEEPIRVPVEEPLIKLESRPPVESFDSLDDPLYERVKQPGEGSAEEEHEPEEPVYAKVRKPKRESVPEEDEADPFPIARPGSPRFLRGLTREEVIRMAKKSDASRRHLRDYESPKGSKDDLSEHPVCMLNQQELDEELRHFRSFFAEQKKLRGEESPQTSTPAGTPLGTPIPRTSTASSTSSTRTKKVTKKKKTTSSSTSSDGKMETREHETHEEHSVFTFETHKQESPERGDAEGTTSPVPPPRSDSLHSLTGPDEKSPPLPPRHPELLIDDDETGSTGHPVEEGRKTSQDDFDDDDSLTDVSAEDLDKYDSDEDGKRMDGSRPTEV